MNRTLGRTRGGVAPESRERVHSFLPHVSVQNQNFQNPRRDICARDLTLIPTSTSPLIFVRRRPSPHLSLPLRRSQILRPPPPSIPPSSITYSNPRSPLPEPVARARGRGCPGAVGIMGLWIHRYPSLAPAGSVRRHHLFDLHSLMPVDPTTAQAISVSDRPIPRQRWQWPS
jgi:hypothetical protein